MKLLCFQAKRFWWKSFSRTLQTAPEHDVEQEVRDAVVVFIHAEKSDEDEDRAASVQRQTLKHIKWIANKRGLKNVVLHSFTHLGAISSSPEYAAAFFEEISRRLTEGGYEVSLTPFGYFCEWDLSVHGDSLAKVWKEIR